MPTIAVLIRRQRGASLLEFAVSGAFITLMGLAILQYGMLYFARNHVDHAAFMAARAGALAHAGMASVQQAYIAALVPMHGGGQTVDALAAAKARATDAVRGTNAAGQNPQRNYARILLDNPTRESFSDWNSPALQQSIGHGSRVIPNSGQAFTRAVVRPGSGQSLRDANLIKLRIVQGYQPKIPLMGALYNRYLTWADNKADPVQTDLLARGLIPLRASVTLPMQSDAIESLTASHPGAGNHGVPTDPGLPPLASGPPPTCAGIGCTVPGTPAPASPGVDCNSVSRPDSCLPAGCAAGDIHCDPICNSPALCCMPE